MIDQVTYDAIRTRIGHASGWMLIGGCFSPDYHGWTKRDGGPMEMVALPDYLNDLNAMHAAVMAQSPTFRKAMRFWLYEITDQMSAHFASAQEMAQAFVLTLDQFARQESL
jgi:cell division inhibitor SulA